MSGLLASAVRRIASGLDCVGLMKPLSLAVGHIGRRSAFPILKYHRVNDEGDPFFPSVSTELFEQQMAVIARVYTVLPLEELTDRMARSAVPRNALAITFDDGYRDNLTHAAPVLARYGLPATIFLATGFIGTGDVPWFDRVALAFKTARASEWRTPWGETIRIEGLPQRLAALDRALEHLKSLAEKEMRAAVETLSSDVLVPAQHTSKNQMLSWDDVHALAGLGFSIGAHTVSHPILSQVSAERAWREIDGSRAMIEAACGRPPRVFAYPNGGAADYTDAVVRLVREAGFQCAVTTRFGVNTAATPRYELRRGGPWEEHIPTFAFKLAAYRLTEA